MGRKLGTAPTWNERASAVQLSPWIRQAKTAAGVLVSRYAPVCGSRPIRLLTDAIAANCSRASSVYAMHLATSAWIATGSMSRSGLTSPRFQSAGKALALIALNSTLGWTTISAATGVPDDRKE